jgi:hypothetical protein
MTLVSAEPVRQHVLKLARPEAPTSQSAAPLGPGP